MTSSGNGFVSLGLKVQRAQYELARIRGIGVVDGIRVEVNAEGHLISLDAPGADAILAAYRQALAELKPKVDAATREVIGDPLVASVSEFVGANDARKEAERRLTDEEAEARYWVSARNDPLGRRRDG